MTPAGSVVRPVRLDEVELLLDLGGEAVLHFVGAAGAHLEERPPAVDREGVSPGEIETVRRLVELGQRPPDGGAMVDARPAHRDAGAGT